MPGGGGYSAQSCRTTMIDGESRHSAFQSMLKLVYQSRGLFRCLRSLPNEEMSERG
jgi:hypothetical protein